MIRDHQKILDLATAGDWEQAHTLVQAHADTLSCHLHGYLHRLEGDLDNARYWYQRGGSPLPDNTLAEEVKRLARLIATNVQV